MKDYNFFSSIAHAISENLTWFLIQIDSHISVEPYNALFSVHQNSLLT